MADSIDGGEEAFAYFVTPQMAEVITGLITLVNIARAHQLPSLATATLRIINGLLSDVNRLSAQMAGVADATIIRKIAETQSANRPWGGVMETHVVSKPAPLGLVRIAMVSELDKIVNPNGYGPFWRAQEYGTGVGEGGYGGGGIPSQVGRQFDGTFEPSGEPPEHEQAGLGVGQDLAFIPGGANPGKGVISVDLPGRHFLRDGAIEAGAKYVQAIDALQARWMPRIDVLREAVVKDIAAKRVEGGGGVHIRITDH